MIVGILLGVSLAILIVSTFFFIYGIVLGLNGNIFTGAVIGAREITSYSLVAFILSLIAVAFFFLFLMRKKNYD